MCATADLLRGEWYRNSTRIVTEIDDRARAVLEADRRKPEYQRALDALREHIKNCSECHNG